MYDKSPLTKEEREQSIAYILQKADLQPMTFHHFLQSNFRLLSSGQLFSGIGDVLFLALIAFLGIAFLVFPEWQSLQTKELQQETYFFVFMLSPFCYGLFYFLGVWKEIYLGTFELKMTLRISLKELMILRMLFFSTFALLVSGLGSFLIWQLFDQQISLLRLLSLSSSSLFLFANGQLWLERQLPWHASYFVTPCLWMLLSGILTWKKEWMIDILLYLPSWLFVGLFILFVGFFIGQLRRECFTKKEGILSNASA